MEVILLSVACLAVLLAFVVIVAPGNDLISLFTVMSVYYIGAPAVEIGIFNRESIRQFNIPDLTRSTEGFAEVIAQQTGFVTLTVLLALLMSAYAFTPPAERQPVKHRLRWLSPKWFFLLSLLFPAFYWMQLGITDRGLIGRGFVDAPLALLLMDEAYRTLTFVAIFASSRSDGLKFALIAIVGGLLFGSRTAAFFPLLYWALHNQVQFFRWKVVASALVVLVVLPFFKPVARWLASSVIGNSNFTLAQILNERSSGTMLISDIDAALPMSWHAMTIHDPFFHQFVGTAWINTLLAPFPDFIFGFDKVNFSAEIASYVNPNYFLDPNGLGFSGIAELYLSGPMSVLTGAVLLALALSGSTRVKDTIFLAPIALFTFKFFRMDIASNIEKSVIFFSVFAILLVHIFVKKTYEISPR